MNENHNPMKTSDVLREITRIMQGEFISGEEAAYGSLESLWDRIATYGIAQDGLDRAVSRSRMLTAVQNAVVIQQFHETPRIDVEHKDGRKYSYYSNTIPPIGAWLECWHNEDAMKTVTIDPVIAGRVYDLLYYNNRVGKIDRPIVIVMLQDGPRPQEHEDE